MFRIFNIKSLKDILSAYIIVHVQGHSHSTDTCTFFCITFSATSNGKFRFQKIAYQAATFIFHVSVDKNFGCDVYSFFFSRTNTNVSFAPNERLAHFCSYTFMCATHNHIQCLNRQKCPGRGYDVQEWTMSTG